MLSASRFIAHFGQHRALDSGRQYLQLRSNRRATWATSSSPLLSARPHSQLDGVDRLPASRLLHSHNRSGTSGLSSCGLLSGLRTQNDNHQQNTGQELCCYSKHLNLLMPETENQTDAKTYCCKCCLSRAKMYGSRYRKLTLSIAGSTESRSPASIGLSEPL
jgi:hypothetical protein